MNKKQKTRLTIILVIATLVAISIGLILYALKQNINLFYTPSQLISANIKPTQTIRIGGFVKEHSVHYNNTGDAVEFIVTDHKQDVFVKFSGVLPSLFREGQGVVATGKLNDLNHFAAFEVLAKHDEKYMPPMLDKALKEKCVEAK